MEIYKGSMPKKFEDTTNRGIAVPFLNQYREITQNEASSLNRVDLARTLVGGC